MAIQIGQQLGSLEVTALLGKGGMGEVYRARDTKLKRDVAIKILPDEFARDADRVNRFQREAEVLASLSHPNIAAIYDLEEAEGSRFLILELVEGETLAERIARGPLPIEEALHIGKSICEALEAAHEKGIVHRDLKPANVKIMSDGRVKVLDFGLAKMFETEPVSGLSNSPTLLSMQSQPGMILGTAPYMSPEQARGRNVDKRTDIWAFGCVLYEMLTGKPVFSGETVVDTLAAVVERSPNFAALPAALPHSTRSLLRQCLRKQPKDRLHDIADARIALQDAIAVPDVAAIAAVRKPAGLIIAVASIVGIAGLIGGVLIDRALFGGRAVQSTVARFTVALPAGEELANTNAFNPLALSPDGKTLSYVGAKSGGPEHLYVRRISDLDAKAIPGTDGASTPFFSPDGQWIGFFAQGKLKKVSISGGAAQVLCDAPTGRGGSWTTDETIYFAPTVTSGLSKVSASGGTPQAVTMLDRGKGEVSHRWPQVLPGGKAVLFTVWTGPGSDEKYLELQVLATGERRVLAQSANSGRYLASGHLVYSQAGALTAVPFDLSRMTVTGPPARQNEQVKLGGEGDDFAVSESGELMYVPGSTENARYLLSVNTKGVVGRLPAPPEIYSDPRISHDGRYAAVAVCAGVCTIAIYDFSRGSLTPLTSTEKGSSQSPAWTPDGKHIAYRGTRSGSRNIFWRAVDGSGDEERLTTSENVQSPDSWSPDGKWLAFTEADIVTRFDLWVLPLDGDRKPRLFLKTPFSELAAKFSPNGNHIAYESSESGRLEIYVRPFPGPGGKTQISSEGGTEPVWSRDGKELFYRQSDKLMAVDVHTESTFTAGVPRKLFEGHYAPSSVGGAGYDVSPDGTRFLMVQSNEPEQASTQINVVLNWTEELKQRVPVR
jgi:serine/threonine-protein kinase